MNEATSKSRDLVSDSVARGSSRRNIFLAVLAAAALPLAILAGGPQNPQTDPAPGPGKTTITDDGSGRFNSTTPHVYGRSYQRAMSMSDPRYLDLDTGAFADDHPPGDLYFSPAESDSRVRAARNMAAIPVPAEKWSALADEVLTGLAEASSQSQIRLGGVESRRTWFFKTREETAGVLRILPHPRKSDSVLVEFKVIRPRREFAPMVMTVLSSGGTNRFLNLTDGRLYPSMPLDQPSARLERDSESSNWNVIVEPFHNYPTRRERGMKLWESMTAEEISEPAGLAGLPFERKGFYPLDAANLPGIILIPEHGLLQIAAFDERNGEQPSAILLYKRVLMEGRPVPGTAAPRRQAGVLRQP